MKDMGMARPEIERHNALIQASNALKWNRFADQGRRDLFWVAAGFDFVKLGDWVLVDDRQLVRLTAATLRMQPGVAGGTYSDDNTRAGFQLTNQWMETWMKANKRPMTDQDVVELVRSRLGSRKVKVATRSVVTTHWAEMDRRARIEREQFLQGLGA